jgi:hypothetical protein
MYIRDKSFQLYPQVKSSGNPLDKRRGRLKNRSGRYGENKELALLVSKFGRLSNSP